MSSLDAARATSESEGGVWRVRVLDEATTMILGEGWTSVTMARLADRVGVSRQTVYNEIGSKPRLAEAMVMRELDAFLGAVDRAFTDHPADLLGAIRAAAYNVLELARVNPLLHAVLSASHGAQSDLLPLLTTQSEPLIDSARFVIGQHLAAYDIPLKQARIDAAVDMVVRLVLSHVMQPSASPADTADSVAWMARRVLQGG